MTAPRRVVLDANGLRFTCLLAGDGDRVAVLLHGFPDDPQSLVPLLERLAGAGFTALAPWMRGYHPTGPAPDGRYGPRQLGADALGLLDALGARQGVVIGHDWGATGAYAAALLDPGRLTHVVGMSVPPGMVFLKALARLPAQRARSRYMARFQRANAAGALRAGGLAEIDALWRAWCPGWEPPPERLAEVKAALTPPGCLEAALSYYKELLARPVRHPLDAGETLQLLARPIEVPGLMLVGAQDGCIAPEAFDGAEGAFRAPARLTVIPDAGHFLTLQQPDAVWAEIRGFLG